MNRLVRLIGSSASGAAVVSSTVMSSILRALRRFGMREAVTPTWLGSKCGASCLSTFSTFQTTASASNAEPSWNFTPGRSLKIHLVLSSGATLHSVATPGITTLALSADERSQVVSPSYMVLPVKRLPSKPWSGWPSVRGMSAAVMPMRTTDWASAGEVDAASSPATAATPAMRSKTSIFITASLLRPNSCFQGACQPLGPSGPASLADSTTNRRASGQGMPMD